PVQKMQHHPLSALLSYKRTATPESYSLSLHDALPICIRISCIRRRPHLDAVAPDDVSRDRDVVGGLAPCQVDHRQRRGHGLHRRSEEHTSELQSPYDLVCRLLLEKKNKTTSAVLLIRY